MTIFMEPTASTYNAVASALDYAALLIDRDGYWDGTLPRPAQGESHERCLVEAITFAGLTEFKYPVIVQCLTAVQETLGLESTAQLPAWSDSHGAQAVTDVLRLTASRLRSDW